MNASVRLALRAYPPSFRARYGAELAALVEDSGVSGLTVFDLAFGAVRAWLHPAFPGDDGPRLRLQASVATTWVAWCAGFLVTPAVNRALLDPPTAGVTGGVHTLLTIAEVLFFVGWGVALIGAVSLTVRCVLPAIGKRDRRGLRSLVPLLLLGAGEAGGLVAIAVTRGGGGVQSSMAERVGLGLWLAGFAVFVVLLGLAPATTIRRLHPTTAVLRTSAWVTLPLAVTLTAATGCSVAAVGMAGHPALLSSSLPVWGALGVAMLASLTALTSSVRGVRVLVR